MTEMSKTKLLIRKKDAVIFFVCIIASAFIFFSSTHEFNKLLLFLPIIYGLCYLIILAPLRVKTGSKTVFWFALTEFIRLVFVPCYESVDDYVGFYGFSTQDMSLLFRSVALMSYECIFVSIFLAVVLRNKIKSLNTKSIKVAPLGNDRIALLIVLLMGVALYLFVPEIRRSLNFLLLASNSMKIRALTTGSQSSIIVGLITFTYDAFLCGFIFVLDYAKRKYDISGKKLYVIVAAVVGLIVVGIINGESRSTLVYTLYAVIVCLGICFEKYKDSITSIVALSGGVVLIGMTAYRLFAVYNHSSYVEALQSVSLRDNYISAFIEMYFLGPQSVACGIHFSDLMHDDFSIGTFFYDIFRPFMGINFIAKAFNSNTSIMMYNSWLSGIEGKSNGLFLQITNQAYCYFGFLFAPVYACVFLRIADYIEDKVGRTKTLFLVFFYNYVFIRLATCVIAGTMSDFISLITMALIVCGAIYLLQKLISSAVKKH